jgi:HAMP domain-containing protein
MARMGRWFLLAVAAILAVMAVRIGSELHYSGCVEAAAVRYQGATDKLSNAVRAQDTQKCTRSPFVHTGQGPVGAPKGP